MRMFHCRNNSWVIAHRCNSWWECWDRIKASEFIFRNTLMRVKMAPYSIHSEVYSEFCVGSNLIYYVLVIFIFLGYSIKHPQLRGRKICFGSWFQSMLLAPEQKQDGRGAWCRQRWLTYGSPAAVKGKDDRGWEYTFPCKASADPAPARPHFLTAGQAPSLNNPITVPKHEMWGGRILDLNHSQWCHKGWWERVLEKDWAECWCGADLFARRDLWGKKQVRHSKDKMIFNLSIVREEQLRLLTL